VLLNVDLPRDCREHGRELRMSSVRKTVLNSLAALAATMVYAAVHSDVRAQASAHGGQGHADAGRSIQVSRLPIGSVDTITKPAPRLSPFPAAQLAAMKAQAAAMRAAPTSPALPVPKPASFPAQINILGDNESESCASTTTAPDQAIAIGDETNIGVNPLPVPVVQRNPIVQMVNDCLSVWSPSGARLAACRTELCHSRLSNPSYTV
jgi:hypothetical protein